uniref:(northern house mosquito) hypothetical protein n=1 Tax=Culex pipiens TaxID=7175 RepID=A0A8D8DKA4_CULPI
MVAKSSSIRLTRPAAALRNRRQFRKAVGGASPTTALTTLASSCNCTGSCRSKWSPSERPTRICSNCAQNWRKTAVTGQSRSAEPSCTTCANSSNQFCCEHKSPN